MSELLKKIVKSQAINEGRFYTREDGKVYESIVTADDSFTGYYQDTGGTLYTPDGWQEEKERQFEEFEEKKKEELRLAQEERAEAVMASKEKIVSSVINRGKKKKNYYKVYIGVAAIFIMLSVLAYGFWERTYKEEEVTIVTVDEPKVENAPRLFGNAIITGDDVNLRLGPSTETDIILSLGKRGERVVVILQDSVTPRWEKIRREDGTQGWIYDMYLNKLETQE